MCRLVAYLGPSRPLGDLVDAPHGLGRQAYDPRELQHGTVNVDGTGLVWWRDGDPVPLRYATTRPPWADANLAALAPRLTGHTIVGAVRGGTPGVGYGDDHVGPFVLGGLAVAHNGWIGGFRERAAARLLRRLPDDLLAQLPVVNDSRLIAALVVAHHRAGASLTGAVRLTLAEVAEVVRELGEAATLNLAVADGTQVVASRASVDLPGNSLYVADHLPSWSGAVVIASEPLDGPGDPSWTAVPDGCLVHLTWSQERPEVTTVPLGDPSPHR